MNHAITMKTNTLTSESLDIVNLLKNSSMPLQAISEREAELIYGGKDNQYRKLDRPQERPLNAWMGGKIIDQGWGNNLIINNLIINIYQINLAINTIIGGAGGSIVNVQGNRSANA